MSVLIQGMEMPKSCEDCSIKSWDCEGYVCPFSGIDTLNIGRQRDCPLVPVPPHGDLIDRDAIPYNKIMLDDDDFYYGVTKPYIDRMPTIIPAEQRDNEP